MNCPHCKSVFCNLLDGDENSSYPYYIFVCYNCGYGEKIKIFKEAIKNNNT